MSRRAKKKKKKKNKKKSRPIVRIETACSVEANWNLVTAYKCERIKNKYVPDLESPLDASKTEKLFLDFLRVLFPIQQACLSNNIDKEAIAGQQGNELARKSFELEAFPTGWLRSAKLGYVIIYQSNALLSAYQIRDKIASVLDELGWDEASYTDVAEKMQPWFDARKEKTTSKKKKAEAAQDTDKGEKGKKEKKESKKSKRYSLSKNLFENVKRSGEHPSSPEINSPYYDFARAAAELCSPARRDKQDKNIIWYDAVPIGNAIYSLRIDLSKILPHYPKTTQISRPRINCEVVEGGNGEKVLINPSISIALTQKNIFNLHRFRTVVAWDIGSDWNNGGAGAKVSRDKNGYNTGRVLGVSGYTISLIQKEKRLSIERDRLQAAVARKEGKHDCEANERELECVRRKLSNLRETIDWMIARDIVEHADADTALIIEDLRWSSGTQSYRHGRIHEHIKHLCAKRGWLCISVSAAHTSQTCSQCSHKNSKKTPLNGDRLFKCDKCGAIEDRDFNAAVNIAMRGFESLDRMLRSRGFFSGNSVDKRKCVFTESKRKKRGERAVSKKKKTPRRRPSANCRSVAMSNKPGARLSVETLSVHPDEASVSSGRCSGLRTPLASNVNPVCDIAVHCRLRQRRNRSSLVANKAITAVEQQTQHS